jgi:hypothetical protein
MFGAGSPVTTSTTINVVGTRVCAIDVHPETAIAQAASAVKLRMLRIECVKCFIGDKKNGLRTVQKPLNFSVVFAFHSRANQSIFFQ